MKKRRGEKRREDLTRGDNVIHSTNPNKKNLPP